MRLRRPRALNFRGDADVRRELQKVISSLPQFPDLEHGDNNQGPRVDAECVGLSGRATLIQGVGMDSTQLLWGSRVPPFQLRKLS